MLRNLFAVLSMLPLAVSHLFAQPLTAPPHAINFQARLTNPEGNPVRDGVYIVRFRLYDAAVGGNVKYEQTLSSVRVKNGIIAALIDQFTINTFDGNTWLGISLGNDAEIAPRTQIVSVPYAIKSNLALTVPNSSITNAKIADATLTADKFAGGTFNSLAWLVNGNSGLTSGFLGTTDANPLELRVNNRRAARYSFAERAGTPQSAGYRSVNVLAGSEFNTIAPDVVGATIAGGGQDIFEWGYSPFPNEIHADFGTISGGSNNLVGSRTSSAMISMGASIGGGFNNTASGRFAVIGGGIANTISANETTISGGSSNTASGYITTIGGGAMNQALEPAATVSGGQTNSAAASGATVSGGYFNVANGGSAVVGGGSGNQAAAEGATVAGGSANLAGGYIATIGGGEQNTAYGTYSVVAGGFQNAADGSYSAVLGGTQNIASGLFSIVSGSSSVADGDYSFAAGRRAKANHDGAFVWSDSTNADFASTANNQFNVRASGGVRLFTKSDLSIGVTLLANDSSWNSVSDRNAKTSFGSVDTLDILERLVRIPITTWNYKGVENPVRHIGPMAQDFFAAFRVGMDDKHIGTIDADGVALAAIQGLNRKLEQSNAALKAENAELRATLAEVLKRLESIEAGNRR